MIVVECNHQSTQSLVEYLAPFETQALFLLGNLLHSKQPCFLYAAMQNDEIRGICGYYPVFCSCSFFSQDTTASRALGRYVAEKHPICALLGMKEMVKPAYDLFLELVHRFKSFWCFG